MELLAPGQCDLDFCAAFGVEINLERHDGIALPLDRTDQLVDSDPLCRSSLRGRLGALLSRPACRYSVMLELISQISPSRASA